MLMESIIIVFSKLTGAAISGHWTILPDCTTLQDPGTSQDYDVLVCQAISLYQTLSFEKGTRAINDFLER